MNASASRIAAGVRESGTDPALPLYVESAGLQYMLGFGVALGLCIGCVLLWLGRRGRVLWLQVWSAGLMLVSIAYFVAALLGYT